MLLAAHGAIKPLGPIVDPFWADVTYMQTFDGIANGTILSDPLPSLKTGVFYSSQNGAYLTVTSSLGRSGNSAQQNQGGVTRIIQTLSGNFTYEQSVFYVSGTTFLFYLQSNFNDIARFTVTSNVLEVFASEGGGYASLGTINQNTWYDCAVSWDGLSLRFFLNGALVLTSTKTNPATSYRLGYGGGLVAIDDVRITAACRYTTSYTPTHPFPAA